MSFGLVLLVKKVKLGFISILLVISGQDPRGESTARG